MFWGRWGGGEKEGGGEDGRRKGEEEERRESKEEKGKRRGYSSSRRSRHPLHVAALAVGVERHRQDERDHVREQQRTLDERKGDRAPMPERWISDHRVFSRVSRIPCQKICFFDPLVPRCDIQANLFVWKQVVKTALPSGRLYERVSGQVDFMLATNLLKIPYALFCNLPICIESIFRRIHIQRIMRQLRAHQRIFKPVPRAAHNIASPQAAVLPLTARRKFLLPAAFRARGLFHLEKCGPDDIPRARSCFPSRQRSL